jgi:hypothetical protein
MNGTFRCVKRISGPKKFGMFAAKHFSTILAPIGGPRMSAFAPLLVAKQT